MSNEEPLSYPNLEARPFPNPNDVVNYLANDDNEEGSVGKKPTDHPNRERRSSSVVDAFSDALNNEEVQAWISPYLQLFTLHGGLGFVAGMATKRFGSNALKYVVTGAVCLQVEL